MMRKIRQLRFLMTTCLSLFLLLGMTISATAQNTQRVEVRGVVFEVEAGNKLVELDFATVSFPDFAVGTTTNGGGKYRLENVPVGKARMLVQYMGKLTIDTLVNVERNMELNFVLKNEDFRLNEVTVTATNSRAGKSTASNISRQAMDHMQATSLYDLMALLPGGLSSEPSLNNSQQISLRQIATTNSSEEDFNALGTAIIRDGAPVSNNSNLSALNPTVTAGASAIGGGASPSGGIDVRSISTENIESVEIIRGIPSVEYGDLTSGAVIIHSKAGREPLRVKAKANPNVYQVSVGTGFDLGGKKGAFNISGDYAYNRNQPTASYVHYERATAKILYSNVFFNNALRSNSSLDLLYGKDQRDPNPDDKSTQTTSRGQDMGFTLNTNGTWNINKGWLKTLRYVVSGTYTSKDSYRETLYSTTTAPYSMTTTDGTTLSNFAGQHIVDANGNSITNFLPGEADLYAQKLSSSYVGRYDIDSRELNAFAKITANLFKQSGNVNNRILLGVDFKTDGNLGEGKIYSAAAPPKVITGDASCRPRRYKDIPFINQFGAFAEENFTWNIGERELNLQAGLRYDNASVVGGVLSPRFNASFTVIPEVLTLRGGYGVTAKMPTLLYLHPETAYFEYVNYDELMNTNIPEANRLYITTTKVYDTQNKNLKIAKNQKAEVGFDLFLGKVKLGVTAFSERLRNGYALAETFDSFKSYAVKEYVRNSAGQLELSGTNSVLSSYNMPTNNLNAENKGIEFDLNLGRIDAIRTAFQLNGSWLQSESWSSGYSFYNKTPSTRPYANRVNVAIYEPGSSKSHRERMAMTLRATHNLPKIGFVVTLTAQTVWQDANWKTFGNDSIPVGYIDLKDAKVHMFEPGKFTTTQEVEDAGYGYLLQNVSHNSAIKEAYSPYFCFNLNVTKEIGDLLRVSFFANNMFRSYPLMESKRNPGSYTAMNNRFFFGLELSLTL